MNLTKDLFLACKNLKIYRSDCATEPYDQHLCFSLLNKDFSRADTYMQIDADGIEVLNKITK